MKRLVDIFNGVILACLLLAFVPLSQKKMVELEQLLFRTHGFRGIILATEKTTSFQFAWVNISDAYAVQLCGDMRQWILDHSKK